MLERAQTPRDGCGQAIAQPLGDPFLLRVVARHVGDKVGRRQGAAEALLQAADAEDLLSF
jgi:hypothetical protein